MNERRDRERTPEELVSSDLFAEFDADDRFLDASTSWLDALGLDPTHLIGTSILDLVHEDDRPAFRESLRKVVESKLATQTSLRVRHRDGTWRWLEGRAVARIDDDGRVRVLALHRDTTERVRAEEELRESEERYRRLVELAPFARVVLVGGRLVYANNAAATLLGAQGPESLLGREVLDFSHPATRALAQERIRCVEQEGRPVALAQEKVVRIDGRVLHVETVAGPIPFEGRQAVQMLIIDVSERQRAEEEREALSAQVQHAQKLESLGRLAGGIAHDFNNLLTGILSNAGLALSELPRDSEARDNLEQIEMSAQRAAELAGLMLTYAGRARFVAEPVSLTRLIETLHPLMRASLGRRTSLRQKLDPDLPLIEGDPTQLQQVLMNLVTNAAESLADGSRVIGISTGVMQVDRAFLAKTLFHDELAEGPCVYLVVSDTGRGMGAATLSRIFEPFFTTKPGGSGLGLASVLGIVRRHHGAIKVDSRPGEGTTVRVLFPVIEGQAARPAAAPDETLAPTAEPGGTVLVIDDEEGIRLAARQTLERAGFRVLTAEDGRSGVSLLRRRAGEIVAVVLDLEMPGMSGEDVVRELQALGTGAPLILSTGYAEDEVLTQFAALPLGGFLQKPYGPAALVTKVRDVLAAARRAQRGEGSA